MRNSIRAGGGAAALAILALSVAGAAAAQAFPAYLNYQGKLGDPSGNPQTGTYSFRFKLYGQSSGGSPLFTDAGYTGGNAVAVANGVYSVQIGSLTAGGIPASVFFSPEVWLEIDVNAGTTLTGAETLAPRERLTASPFAFLASNANYLGSGAAIATFTSAGNMLFPGSVGIGTTIPGTKLEVVNAPTFSILTLSTAATSGNGSHIMDFGMFDTKATITSEWSGLPLRFKARGSDQPDLVVSTSGNVGIGTTSPGATLEVNGSGRFDGSDLNVTNASTNGTQMDLVNTSAGGHNWSLVSWGSAAAGGGLVGKISFYDNTVGHRLLIDTAGNVGIGTTGPNDKLHVLNGNVLIRASTGTFYVTDAGAPNNGGAPPVLMVDQSGVGGWAGLMIKGNAVGSNYPVLSLGLTNSNARTIEGAAVTGVITGATAGSETMDMTFSAKPAAGAVTEYMRLTSGGNVGIGTTSPGTAVSDYAPLLHVKSATPSDAGHWSGRVIASGPSFAVTMGEVNGVSQIAGHNAALTAWANLSINSGGGNVGIGTSSPATKLHLSSGTITIDGTGAPTQSQALCLAAGGALGHCTSAVGAGGGCTCVSP